MSLSFNLTTKCNLKCEICWQYGNKGIFQKESPVLLEEEMRLELLTKIVDEVSGSLRNITLWGGEPMLHPDFFQFAAYIKKKSIYLNIITNGTFLKKFAEQLVEIKVDNLVVSVDGQQEIHDKIRGVKGSYQKIAEGLDAIRNLKSGSSKNLPKIEVNYTISHLNFDKIFESIKVFENLSISSIIISHLWFTDKDTYEKNEKLFNAEFNSNSPYFKAFLRDVSSVDLKILESEILRVKNEKWRIPVSFLPDLDSKDVFPYYRDLKNIFGFHSCFIPWVTAGVLPNGDLTPCSDRPDFIVGNLKRESFRELWNSERFRLYRKALKHHRLFPMCSRCCELFRQ